MISSLIQMEFFQAVERNQSRRLKWQLTSKNGLIPKKRRLYTDRLVQMLRN